MSNTLFPQNELSDEADQYYIILFNQRKNEGWEHFHYRFYDDIFAYVARILDGSKESHDIAIESFIATWRIGKTFDRASELKNYLKTAAHNKCIDHLKDLKKFKHIDLYKEIPDDNERDPDLDPEEQFRYQRILELAKELPRPRKRVFQEIVIEGKKNKKYAEENGQSENHVASDKFKALAWIRKKLGGNTKK